MLTITPGSVVEWVNLDGDLHATAFVTGTTTARSLTSTDGWASYKRQFDTLGTYTYEDSANPGLTAQIIVSNTTPTSTKKIYLPIVQK